MSPAYSEWPYTEENRLRTSTREVVTDPEDEVTYFLVTTWTMEQGILWFALQRSDESENRLDRIVSAQETRSPLERSRAMVRLLFPESVGISPDLETPWPVHDALCEEMERQIAEGPPPEDPPSQ